MSEALGFYIKTFAATVSVVVSLIGLFMKLRDRRASAPAKLAVSNMSWDAKSRLPIYPLPTPKAFTTTPFPFIDSNLGSRFPSKDGWFTISKVMIWNASKQVILGSFTKTTSNAYLCIPTAIGRYEVRSLYSNDQEMLLKLGSPHLCKASKEYRYPIAFDYMHAEKGGVIFVMHNHPEGTGIRITAFTEKTPNCVQGTVYVFSPKFTRVMNNISDVALPVFLFLTAYFYKSGQIWGTVFCAVMCCFAFMNAYLHRNFVYSPKNL
jgi:hypothetical protein